MRARLVLPRSNRSKMGVFERNNGRGSVLNGEYRAEFKTLQARERHKFVGGFLRQFVSFDFYFRRSLDAQFDRISAAFHDRQNDIITDPNFFADFPSEN